MINTALPQNGPTCPTTLWKDTTRPPSNSDRCPYIIIRSEWVTSAEDPERTLAKHKLTSVESYNCNTHPLFLCPGPNQTSNHPLRWNTRGRIVATHDRGQYIVRLGGSGRCTLRNCSFLHQYHPFCKDLPVTPESIYAKTPTPETASSSPGSVYIKSVRVSAAKRPLQNTSGLIQWVQPQIGPNLGFLRD